MQARIRVEFVNADPINEERLGTAAHADKAGEWHAQPQARVPPHTDRCLRGHGEHEREVGVSDGCSASEAQRVEQLRVRSDTSQAALRNAGVHELNCGAGTRWKAQVR